MEKHWIVVAQRDEARIFEKEKNGNLHLLETIENPSGRLKNQELSSTRPGRSFSSAGPVRHGLTSENEPTEQNSLEFAKKVAKHLDDAKSHGRFDTLTLVSGPHFLGLLRKDLSASTCACIGQTLNKNLGGFNPREIEEYLSAGSSLNQRPKSGGGYESSSQHR